MDSLPPEQEPAADREPDHPTGVAVEPAAEHAEPGPRGAEQADEPDAAAPRPGRPTGWARFVRLVNRPTLALLAIGLIAGIPRFANLSYPHDKPNPFVFDETYYAKDGCLYAGHQFQKCDLTSDSEQSWVHPPLGKWMVAIGIKLFGFTPFGWRFSAALFGTATVVLLALLAYLLFGSVLWAFLTGLLIATESLEFVQSRVALLDIFVAFWVVLGFLFIVLDRRYIDRRTPPRPEPEPEPPPQMGLPDPEVPPLPPPPRRRVPSPLWRPWRFAAGFAFGAGFATKWNGLPALLGAIALVGAWEIARRLPGRDWVRAAVQDPWSRRAGLRLERSRRPSLWLAWILGLAGGAGFVLAGRGFGKAIAGTGSFPPAIRVLIVGAALLSASLWLVARSNRRRRWLAWLLPIVALIFLGGLAAGSKHSGLAVAAFAAAVLFALLSGAIRATAPDRLSTPGLAEATWMAVRQESFTIFLGMVVLPLLVYIGSFSGRITSTSPSSDGRCPYHTDVYTPGLGWRFSLAQLWHLQGEIACFHEHLSAYNATTDKTGHTIETPAHPYESRPWEWIYLGRPVAYYFHGPGTEILGIGNPAIFWFAILAVPWVGFMALRRRDWKAGLIFVAVAAQYLPWFIPPALDKVQFLFYATPISPFFVLADVYVLRDLSRFRLVGSRSRPFLPIAIGFIVTSVAVFAWFWPVLTGYHLSGHAWHQRMWFPRWI